MLGGIAFRSVGRQMHQSQAFRTGQLTGFMSASTIEKAEQALVRQEAASSSSRKSDIEAVLHFGDSVKLMMPCLGGATAAKTNTTGQQPCRRLSSTIVCANFFKRLLRSRIFFRATGPRHDLSPTRISQ